MKTIAGGIGLLFLSACGQNSSVPQNVGSAASQNVAQQTNTATAVPAATVETPSPPAPTVDSACERMVGTWVGPYNWQLSIVKEGSNYLVTGILSSDRFRTVAPCSSGRIVTELRGDISYLSGSDTVLYESQSYRRLGNAL